MKQFSKFKLRLSDHFELISALTRFFELVGDTDRDSFKKFAIGLLNNYAKPGTYQSPLETITTIEKKKGLKPLKDMKLKDINLNTDEQLALLNNFKSYYNLVPFSNKEYTCRYYPDNTWFITKDAIILFCMIMHLKPQRIIEIGSGFSSALTLDTNSIYFDNSLKITFIEPNPSRLLSLLTNDDLQNVDIHQSEVQSIDKKIFRELKNNDILFIDSSHVSKVFSDVNFIFFEVLPELNDQVYIHFHDIFFPFDYPLKWYREGRFFNEAYILRAFLQNNLEYKISFWTNYLTTFYPDKFINAFPEIDATSGGSFWMRKISSS